MDRKEEISRNLYYFLLDLWEIITTLTVETTFPSIEVLHLHLVYKILRIIIYSLLVLRTLFYLSEYSQQQKLMMLILIAVAVITFFHTRCDFLYPAYLFLISSYGIDMNKALEKVLNVQILLAAVTIFSCMIGIIPNNIINRYAIQRMPMGYVHVNTMGCVLLTVSLLTFYLFHQKSQKRVYITSAVCFLAAHFVADSRASSALILAVIFAQIIDSIVHVNEKKRTDGFICFSQRILEHSGLSFFLIIIFNFLAVFVSPDAGAFLPITFRLRFYSGYTNLKYYPMNLFGQPIYLNNSNNQILTQLDTKYGIGALDNAYVFLLLGLGLINSIIFIGAYYKRIKMGEEKREYILLVVFLIYAVYGMMERALIMFCFNCFMLLFADLIWKKPAEQSERIHTESMTG